MSHVMPAEHIVIVTFHPRPEHEETFHDAMLSVRRDLPTVQGCNGVQVFRHHSDRAKYTLVESWQDQQSHSDHIDQFIASGAWKNLEEMLFEAPSTSFLSPA